MAGGITQGSIEVTWEGFTQAMHERGISPMAALHLVDVGRFASQDITPRQELAARFVEALLKSDNNLADTDSRNTWVRICFGLADVILSDGKEE